MGRWTHIWEVPAFLEYVGEPISDVAVAEAEARLGVRLPEALIEALEDQNGGLLRYRQPGTSLRRITPLEKLGGPWCPATPEGLVAFDGFWDWAVGLDYRGCGPDGPPAVTRVSRSGYEVFAPDVETWLAGLRYVNRRAVLLVTGVGRAEVLRRLSSLVGCVVDEPEDGYPDGFAQRKLHRRERWSVTLSSNEVAAGYRGMFGGERTSQTRHRFPEHPDARTVLEVDRGLHWLMDDLVVLCIRALLFHDGSTSAGRGASPR